MSELAFNINGEAFEVPAQAAGWRVRRMRAKSSPEVVCGRDGMPLVLPVDPVLLGAADGAGLPARKPKLLAELAELEPSDDDGEDTATDMGSPTIELIKSSGHAMVALVWSAGRAGEALTMPIYRDQRLDGDGNKRLTWYFKTTVQLPDGSRTSNSWHTRSSGSVSRSRADQAGCHRSRTARDLRAARHAAWCGNRGAEGDATRE